MDKVDEYGEHFLCFLMYFAQLHKIIQIKRILKGKNGSFLTKLLLQIIIKILRVNMKAAKGDVRQIHRLAINLATGFYKGKDTLIGLHMKNLILLMKLKNYVTILMLILLIIHIMRKGTLINKKV
jgi:hypothetical protein